MNHYDLHIVCIETDKTECVIPIPPYKGGGDVVRFGEHIARFLDTACYKVVVMRIPLDLFSAKAVWSSR